MSVKDEVLHMLEINKGQYFSGANLAKELNVSRNSIWKAIKSLEHEGYSIDAVPNKGYCLCSSNDILSKHSIGEFLDIPLDIRVYDTITSTSTVLKEMAEHGAKEGTVLVAKEQTLGRGRFGRTFISPSGTGIYFSVLLRPEFSAKESLFLTTCAAVAVCNAIEDVSDRSAKIKWVNDVYCDDKKVCGILTEGAFNAETGGLDYAIVGIGINICLPEGGFPSDINDVATAIFTNQADANNKQSKLVANTLNYFINYYKDIHSKAHLQQYIDRSMLIGREINVIEKNCSQKATALSINDECKLLVKLEDGTKKLLSSGEVSIKIK